MNYGEWTSWRCTECRTDNWYWRGKCYVCGQNETQTGQSSHETVPLIAEVPGAPAPPAKPPDGSMPPPPPGPLPKNRPPELDCDRTMRRRWSRPLAHSGPLPHDNVWWLTHPEAGPILCVADDGTTMAKHLLSYAHQEMEWVLGSAEAQVDHFDKSSDFHCQLRDALRNTSHVGWPFCVAWSYVPHAGNRFLALGLASQKSMRERCAKASLAVTMQLHLGLAGKPELDALLPLARQCAERPQWPPPPYVPPEPESLPPEPESLPPCSFSEA